MPTACHRSGELPPPDAIVPADGALSPTLERLVAAFSNRMEGAGRIPGLIWSMQTPAKTLSTGNIEMEN